MINSAMVDVRVIAPACAHSDDADADAVRRLQMEHDRLIGLIRSTATSTAAAAGDKAAAAAPPSLVVADMMAGVGPFAVPLAMLPSANRSSKSAQQSQKQSKEKKQQPVAAASSIDEPRTGRSIVVHANGVCHILHTVYCTYTTIICAVTLSLIAFCDCYCGADLNPASYKYLTINAKANHCGARLLPHNLDGRDFILQLLAEGVPFEEVIMNLPQTAIDFLDVFVGVIPRLREK